MGSSEVCTPGGQECLGSVGGWGEKEEVEIGDGEKVGEKGCAEHGGKKDG